MRTSHSTCPDLGIAQWYRHHLQAGDMVPLENINPKADYYVSAAVSLFHRDPCIQKKQQQKEKKNSVLLFSPLEEKHLAHSAERLFLNAQGSCRRKDLLRMNLLLIAIKLWQSTAEETKSCPLNPIHNKPVLTPAVPHPYCTVLAFYLTMLALNATYLVLRQERGSAS